MVVDRGMEAVTTREVCEQSRVLLLASPTAVSAGGLCTDLMHAGSAHETHALEIAYNRSPDAVVEDWRQGAGELPASMAIICPESRHVRAMPEDVHVTTVAPSDLTGVGIAVTRYLDRWKGSGREITVCLDSLTTVLQYADVERVFRFLHTLNGRFVAADATAHVHLDPAAQDDQTVSTIATLFDAVIAHENGQWVVE